MTEAEIDSMARNLYDVRKTVGPPVSDSGWAKFKESTPNAYRVLRTVAEGLLDNES